MQYRNQQDKIDRHINAYATQSFRDQADRDYIAARLACRAELMPQFLWAAQQAVEKYIKAVLLYNRVKVPKLTHDIQRLWALTSSLPAAPFQIELSPRSLEFLRDLSESGQNRYMEKPYAIDGYVLADLDLTVWELRRYCQVLNVFGKALPPAEEAMVTKALADLAESSPKSPHKFGLPGGFLEGVLTQPRHPARAGLVWNNLMYSVRKRKHIKVKDFMEGANPWLYLFPEMLDELLKYSPIPDRIAHAYRDHLDSIRADPTKRP